MSDKLLVKQFNADPGSIFLEIIRSASGAIDAAKIMAPIQQAGVSITVVREKWKSAQRFVNEHPHVDKPTSRLYTWTPEPKSPTVALDLLAAKSLKSVPPWLISALKEVISDNLSQTETSGPSAQLSWNDQRRMERAQVLADIAAQAAAKADAGATSAELLEWLQERTEVERLEPIGAVGDRLDYDPNSHDLVSGSPKRGDAVEMVKPGYRWLGAAQPTVVVRAAVRVPRG